MTTFNQKKHPCPDCKHCQQCSSVRCHLCRGQGADAAERRFAGLSLAGQIELFEAVNRGDKPEGRYPAEQTGCRAELFTTISPSRGPVALTRPARLLGAYPRRKDRLA